MDPSPPAERRPTDSASVKRRAKLRNKARKAVKKAVLAVEEAMLEPAAKDDFEALLVEAAQTAVLLAQRRRIVQRDLDLIAGAEAKVQRLLEVARQILDGDNVSEEDAKEMHDLVHKHFPDLCCKNRS